MVKTGLIGESKEENLVRFKEMGIEDPDRIYNANELACSRTVLFAVYGITPGTLMERVRFFPGGVRIQSLAISSHSAKTASFVDTIYLFYKPKSINLH